MGRPRGFGRTTPRKAAGVGRRRRGVCPVCRATHALRDTDGKMMPHGKSAARPRGCDGVGQAPIRDATRPLTGGVRPLVEPVAHDAPPEPDLGLDVMVQRRDDTPPVRVRSARPDGPGAA